MSSGSHSSLDAELGILKDFSTLPDGMGHRSFPHFGSYLCMEKNGSDLLKKLSDMPLHKKEYFGSHSNPDSGPELDSL